MNICVIAQPSSWYVADLKRAASRHGDQILVTQFSEITGQVGIESDQFGPHKTDQIDLVLVRSMPPGSLEQVVFRMNAIQQFAVQTQIPIVNAPRSMEIAVDKYLCLCKLASARLPVPQSRVSQKSELAMEHFFELDSNVVVKPIFGGEGRGVMRIDCEDLAWRTFKTLERSNSVIYLQQFIEADQRDTRILLIGDEHFVMQRHNPDDWRSNVSRGAKTYPAQASESQLQLARRAAEACGCVIAGIDLITDQKNQQDYILEVNAVPGWQALGQCLDVDIADHVLNFCRTVVEQSQPKARARDLK